MKNSRIGTDSTKKFPDACVGRIKAFREELKTDRYTQIAVIITFIAAFLRFFHLDFNSLWLDEAVTYNIAQNSFIGIWKTTAGGEFNPPLFNWIEHLISFVGTSEWALRFIPALLGTLTVFLFYWIGREYGSRGVGIIVAAFLATSPFHIMWSQDARAYTTMLFFLSLAFLFYGKAIDKNDCVNWLIFGFFSALAFWTHFYALIIVAVLFLFSPYLLSAAKGGIGVLRNTFYALILFFILTLPLIVVMIDLFILRTGSSPTYGIQGLDVITYSLLDLAGFNIIALVVLAVLFFSGVWYMILRNRKIAALTLGTVIIAFLVSMFLSYRMPMEPRYLIILLPFLFLGIGYSSCTFSKYVKKETVLMVLLIFAVLLNASTLEGYYTSYTKDDLRTLSQEIHGFSQNNDIIVLMPAYMTQPFNYYYDAKKDGTTVVGASSTDDLMKIFSKKGNSRILFIISESDLPAADPQGTTIAWIKEKAVPIGRFMGYIILIAA